MTVGRTAHRPRTGRRFLLGAVSVALGVLLPLLLIEAVLRFLPVTEPVYAQPVNERMPYRHFLPNRDVTYSRGWDFSIVTRKHINNFGFTSDVDFVRDDASPLLVVIGDSFVEAWQVPDEQTLQSRLAARVAGRGRVYGIGFSGSPLSQYLAYAEMARKEFAPRAMAIVIVGNDFDESLIEYKREPGYYYFGRHGNELVLERIDHPGQNWEVALASKSSLAMYVRHTIGFDIRRVSAALDPEPAPEAGFAGNVAIEASTERVANSDAAIAAFLAQLPLRSGLGPEQILFVIDAIRPQLYEPAALARAEASYFGQMRRHFMQQASAARFEVLDMTAAFAASFEQDKQRFEFPGDNHWNALGHRVVADQVAASRVFARTFR